MQQKQDLMCAPHDDIDLAKRTLHDICEDTGAPASARAQAARTLLELAGALKNTKRDQALTPAAELTSEELDQRLREIGLGDPAHS